MLRNPTVTLRTPEPTSVARVKGFNRLAVGRFYDLLVTGVYTSSNGPPKVLSTYGKRQVGIISSNEKGVTTTIICCCNVTGTYLPPFFIF
nr:unnamed protein product [Callosobruchus analis]